MSLQKPNNSLYPFRDNYFNTGRGNLHYIDTGGGYPVVFLHGNPTWSFLYRNLIKQFSNTYRCIAPDYLGFGKSDPPINKDFSPKAAASDIEQLFIHLQLKDITLVVHDFGGPIGLSFAVKYPERIKKIILFNTWMWSNEGNFKIKLTSAIFNSFIGKFLFLKLNFGINGLLRLAWVNKEQLTDEVLEQYKQPLKSNYSRYASWSFAKALGGENKWFKSLWQQRDKLKDIPFLILWGKKDPAFSISFLKKWQKAFPHAQVQILDSGHFVPEEVDDLTINI